MRTYWSLFKLRFINNLQYRAASYAGLLTQLFFGFVFISVYLAFYESNPQTALPMEWQALVDYLWLNQAFFALVNTYTRDKDLLSMIKNGNIAYEFIRPINFYKKWYITMYANRLSNVLLRCPPILLITILLPYPFKLGFPFSLTSFLVFLFSLVISSLIITAFNLICHLITFYTLDEKGVMAMAMVFAEIFAGGTIPLTFFPKILQVVAYILPFRYICDLPFRIYSGNISVSKALPDLLGGSVWVIVLLIIGLVLTKKISKKALIQGG